MTLHRHFGDTEGVAGKIMIAERRAHRRHDLEGRSIKVDRWDGMKMVSREWGQLIDLSASGVRIRTNDDSVKPGQQVRVRIELPSFAGICPFVQNSAKGLEPKREWVGWMTVVWTRPYSGNECEVAGRLADMDELDRGMLSLYLSTQPLAA